MELIDSEMALNLDDLLIRRSLLAETGQLRGAKGQEVVQAAATAMAAHLNWAPDQRERQVQQLLKALKRHDF